ncbi:MAG TPA: metallophosphoesterase [Gemmataceae bacterium]|nr:metallophosphoesterase [Gemmataceae bacterium]
MTKKDELPKSESVLRIAAAADLHCTKNSVGQLSPLLARMAEAADILLLGGDLTDFGLPEEAHVLVRELSAVKVPIVAVLGNHDFESGKQGEIHKILTDAGVRMLDGDACEIKGIGFAGVKGFAGGFGRATLGAWGEDIIKHFVQEAINETMKLESALARLRMPQRIAVLHYAPIQATVEGEPPEIFAFLGCGRLAEPLERYGVTAVFHGHAHRGTHEGKTSSGIPVYNVSLPLMKRHCPDRPLCRILEIPVGAIKEETAAGKAGGAP